MVEGVTLSLRTRKPEPVKRPMSIRLSDELRDYLERTAARDRTDMTSVIEDAIRLDRDLATMLEARRDELEAFAASQHLDLATSLPRVVGLLVLEAMDAHKR